MHTTRNAFKILRYVKDTGGGPCAVLVSLLDHDIIVREF